MLRTALAFIGSLLFTKQQGGYEETAEVAKDRAKGGRDGSDLPRLADEHQLPHGRPQFLAQVGP